MKSRHAIVPLRLRSESAQRSNRRAEAAAMLSRVFPFSRRVGASGGKVSDGFSLVLFDFWLPKYLADVRGLNIQQIGNYAWIPYAFAGLGSLSGGALSSLLIRRGFPVNCRWESARR